MTDAVLATKAKLYSQPGISGTSQDHRPPPGLAMVVAYSGMLVGATGSDVWYSAQNVSGEGAWFNPIFQIPIPGAGDITALAVMDGTLFVFKRSEIYAMAGEAPSDNGSSGGLGAPRRLSCDVGCIESRSTCTTAYGVFFQSDRGIEILTRAQTVEWIGLNIQQTTRSFPICTSITVDARSSAVLVELAASQSGGMVTGAGRALVYDLKARSWVSADRRKSAAGVADTPAQSASMVYLGGQWIYSWLQADGTVNYETRTSRLDADGSFVAKRAVCANVKSNGLMGLQHVNRVQMLAKRYTDHDFTMSIAYDYAAAYTNPRTWSAAELAAFAIPSQQLEHTMGDDAECQAVRVQLQDVTPSSGSLGIGTGATWIALCFEVVPKTGAYLLPDASR